mgnify:CR=1 FL=1
MTSDEYFPLLIPRTDKEYQIAIEELSRLMSDNPDRDSNEHRKLETIASNIESYERKKHPVPPPDPVDAIRFRMEQKNLKQRDLIPFIGTKSRVSEVLNRKRPLTYEMAQNLYKGLSIPADVLLSNEPYTEPIMDWEKFPLKEMLKRGWIDSTPTEIKKNAEAIIREFLKPLGMSLAPTILFKKTKSTRVKRDLEDYALLSWMGRIAHRAEQINLPVRYERDNLNEVCLRELVNMSVDPNGPALAVEYLQAKGIHVVVEKSLKGANLDAVLIHRFARHPIIGISLLRDRLDNFWFSLFHEIGHLILHTSNDSYHFVDNFEVRYTEDPRENEADTFAREMLLPSDVWRKSNAFRIPSPSAVKLLAKKQKISPAIVAGRIRYETNNYQLLHQMIGQGEVSKAFANWKDGS